MPWANPCLASECFHLSGGIIRPGSRTPVRGLSAWATLQVVTGGFATAHVLSGGPLQPRELAWLETLGLQRLRGDAGRHALNTWCLTEQGRQQLGGGCNRAATRPGFRKRASCWPFMAWRAADCCQQPGPCWASCWRRTSTATTDPAFQPNWRAVAASVDKTPGR
jgi:hypothetical protein